MVIIETPKVQLAVQLATQPPKCVPNRAFASTTRSARKVMSAQHCDLPFETMICKCVPMAVLISDLSEKRVKCVVYYLNFLRDRR